MKFIEVLKGFLIKSDKKVTFNSKPGYIAFVGHKAELTSVANPTATTTKTKTKKKSTKKSTSSKKKASK